MKTHPGGDRPKVLLVAPQPFYEDRGTPIAVRHVLEALAQLGLESHLLTFPVGKPVEIPGLRITRCANPFGIRSVPVGLSVRKVLLDLTLLAVLRRELRRHDYACIHAVEEMVLPALLLSRRIGVPVVYDMQSSIPEQLLDHWCLGRRPFQAALRRGEKWTIANADFVVSSTGLAERVHASCVSSKHREWVFPGPDFVAHATMTDRVRARLGLPSDQPLIVFAGTFERYQGINLLLKAIPMVLEVQPDVLFVLVGSRDEKDARLPEDHALPANAVRVIQRQPRESTLALCRLADVLVSPRIEGSNVPLKVFDYLADGGLIVATDVPSHRSVLDQHTAILVEPRPAALAEGILRALRDPEMAASVRAAAAEFSKTHLGWPRFVQSVREIYEAVGISGQMSETPKPSRPA